jgi:membrane protease YdiL (CAAX protease family)
MKDDAKALVDLIAVVGIYLVTLSILVLCGVGGPIPILVSLAVASWRLWARGSGWLALGLTKHPSALRTAGMVVGVMILATVAAGGSVALVTQLLGWPPISTAHYGELTGKLPRFLWLLAVAWTSAAFGEEMLFRGFVLTRVEALVGRTMQGAVVAVVFQAILFGAAHYKQGPTGMVSAGMVGLVYGAFYARFRTLVPLIIAHGLTDTVGLLVIYSGGR